MNVLRAKSFLLTFLVILVIATFFRFYQLGTIPSGFSWDEAVVGYDAWSIATSGMDSWGHHFPLVFTSFEDDKHPVHIYFTALSEVVFGMNEFGTRFPSAFFGVANVLMLGLLAYSLSKNKLFALLAAMVFALSPYDIQFSRWNHEFNFAIFFFVLGGWLFYQAIQYKPRLLPLAFLSWGIDLLVYHSVEVVLPPVFFYLMMMYRRELWKLKKLLSYGLVIFVFFLMVIVTHPALLGTARINQTSYSNDELSQVSSVYRQTQNRIEGMMDITVKQYFSHFSYHYLFVSGDSDARHSDQQVGELYKLDLPFLLIGFLALLWKRTRWSFFILAWAVVAPLPASLVKEAPHAARAMFMAGSFHLIIAYGMYTVLQVLPKKQWHYLGFGLISLAYLYLTIIFFQGYSTTYNTRYAIEWQYGMKQIAQYIQNHPDYIQVYMTKERHQPYIYFLYYLHTPTQKFLDTVGYNETESRSYNLVSYYDKYFFGNWETVESMPNMGVLYVLTPSEYDGLKHKKDFQVKEKITYPNGNDAFYLVSVN